jgi:hypothetical protein
LREPQGLMPAAMSMSCTSAARKTQRSAATEESNGSTDAPSNIETSK